MYRLICPVVDDALDLNGLEAFFEYSQPNGPNKRLSADIAIVHGEQPIWLIEAKKFTQKLHPELVGPYLKPGVMGVVTNGNHWIFLVRGKTAVLGPMVLPDGNVDRDLRLRIVRMLSARSEDDAILLLSGWSDAWKSIERSGGPPLWRLNKGEGSREFAAKETFTRLRDAVQTALPFAKPDSPTEMFLEELLQSGIEVSHGRVEVSSKRLIWWVADKLRGARINLESSQLDMLVSNLILEAVGTANIAASIKLHDKNHAMSTCKASTLPELRSLVLVFNEGGSCMLA